MNGRRPVRVLHVLTRLSRGGGIQSVVRRLAESVDPAEVELHVLTIRPRRAEDRLEELPARVHMLNRSARGYPLWVRPKVMAAVAREVGRIRPDVLHLHSGLAWLGALARATRRRMAVVLEVHDAPGSGRHGWVTDHTEGWWPRWFGATALCHSTSVASEVRTRWHVPVERLVMFPLAVSTEQFDYGLQAHRRRWRASRGIPDDAVVLIAVGRLASSKRFDLAIEAVAATRACGREVMLLLVGAGTEAQSLQAQVERLGLQDHVFFAGPLFGVDLVAAYQAADVVCSPSSYEGFGLTIVEGMACGLPVVAAAVGGVTDLVVDGTTGRLVDPDDRTAFVAAIGEVVADADLRDRWGRAGRQRAVERFSLPVFGRAFTDLYRSLAGS